MKAFKEVQANQIAYHKDGARNSIHRASLLVPEIKGANVNVSFLNHFLIKRDNANVGCRVSAIAPNGKRIESRLIDVNDPRVYTIPLTGMVDEPTASYMVEFFTDKNLYYPFPAVMVNHRGAGFLNCVHSFNRVLNDVFEDDEINLHHQREAAIDVRFDDVGETFLEIFAGPKAVCGDLNLELSQNGAERTATVNLDIPKLCHQRVMLSEAFPDLQRGQGGVLKVLQPPQFLFYGRLFVGQVSKDGAFSANHSYYDNSNFEEYWENSKPSARLYPFFRDLENVVRIYPILSPGQLQVDVRVYAHDGSLLHTIDAGILTSPGVTDLDISVNDHLRDAGIELEKVASYAPVTTPTDGNTPARVNYQIVYHSGELESSINMSSVNPNFFSPLGKKGLTWGQFPVGAEIDSYLGMTFMHPEGDDAEFVVSFYDQNGHVVDKTWSVPSGSAVSVRPDEIFDAERIAEIGNEIEYFWFEVRSARSDISAYVVTRDRSTGHCSGEHSF